MSTGWIVLIVGYIKSKRKMQENVLNYYYSIGMLKM